MPEYSDSNAATLLLYLVFLHKYLYHHIHPIYMTLLHVVSFWMVQYLMSYKQFTTLVHLIHQNWPIFGNKITLLKTYCNLHSVQRSSHKTGKRPRLDRTETIKDQTVSPVFSILEMIDQIKTNLLELVWTNLDSGCVVLIILWIMSKISSKSVKNWLRNK